MRSCKICIFLIYLLQSFTKVTLLDHLHFHHPLQHQHLKQHHEFQHQHHSTLSLVKKLTAVCGKDGIKVIVKFNQPFTGVVYSDGHYDTPKCIFINQQNNSAHVIPKETKFSFFIPADECGTVFSDGDTTIKTSLSGNDARSAEGDPAGVNEVYMENTVMFQRNLFIQEQGDLAQTLRCVWQKEIRRPLQATLPLLGKHQIHKHKHPLEKVNKSSISPALLSPPVTNTDLGWNWHRNRNSYHHHHQKTVTNADTGPLSHSAPQQQQHQQNQDHQNYLASSYKKRFQPNGHVESISLGGRGRRAGKSLALDDIESYSETISPVDLNRFRSLYNLTALAFRSSDIVPGSGATCDMFMPTLGATIAISLISLFKFHICDDWFLSI